MDWPRKSHNSRADSPGICPGFFLSDLMSDGAGEVGVVGRLEGVAEATAGFRTGDVPTFDSGRIKANAASNGISKVLRVLFFITFRGGVGNYELKILKSNVQNCRRRDCSSDYRTEVLAKEEKAAHHQFL